MFVYPQASGGFVDELPKLFDMVLTERSDYMSCVAAVVDTLCLHTGWDRVIYSELRRVPQFSEVIYVANALNCSVPLAVREVPCVSVEALEMIEQFGGAVEVAANSSNPSYDDPQFSKLQAAERFAQEFLRTNGIRRAVYAPRRLTPNFVQLLAFHRCDDDRSMTDEDALALRLAHIVLAQISERKRWRFALPGRTAYHDQIMPLLADGWEPARIAAELSMSLPLVDRMVDEILSELQVQFGLRNSMAAIVFLRGELAKPV